MSVYGLNILPNRRDNGALFPYLARLRGRWNVVMDDGALAVGMREQGHNVIARYFHVNDARFHETMTPAQFIASYAPMVKPHNLVLQVLNEPVVVSSTDCQKLVKWLLEVIRLADIAGIRLCVANFAMGNPHESLIESGVFDDLIRAIVRADHILGLHEYAKHGDLQVSWLIGRYRRWLDRARIIGARELKIVITECGYDIGGGRGDGYRLHVTSERMAEIARAMATVYAQDDVSACFYCCGDGFGWGSFNCEGDTIVMDELVKANEAKAETAELSAVTNPPLDFNWGAMRAVWIMPFTIGSIVRKAPDKQSDRLTSFTVETRVFGLSTNTWTNDGYDWYRVQLIGGAIGYIAKSAVLSIRLAGTTAPLPDTPVEVPPVVVEPEVPAPTVPETGPIVLPPPEIPLPEDNAALRNNILSAFREIEINAAESARNQQAVSDAAASLRKLLANTWNIELVA